ncbi:MAG TPA: hypothetical protein PKC32_14240 [Sphingopyxis sp.]|nr:hypothetical protein [Sphingopyxis sp.]
MGNRPAFSRAGQTPSGPVDRRRQQHQSGPRRPDPADRPKARETPDKDRAERGMVAGKGDDALKGGDIDPAQAADAQPDKVGLVQIGRRRVKVRQIAGGKAKVDIIADRRCQP